ncbi:MAG: site-specific integrase [Oscillospiraceae bacterium]|nr:site-specific integrase [Oscillospiraceae bacterium]
MASITNKQRAQGPVYYIVYSHVETDGSRKQYWIRCNSFRDATNLLPEVEEYEKQNLFYPIPIESQRYRIGAVATQEPTEHGKKLTVKALILEYIEHRCQNGLWEAATCKYNESLCKNYIFPYIGNHLISKITTRDLQLFYNDLPNHKAVRQRKKDSVSKISKRTVREIHKIIRPAFAYAVVLGYLKFNPASDLQQPRIETKKRAQWSEEEVKQAIDLCEDADLSMMMQVMFCATARSGELLGLQWQNTHIFGEDAKQPYIYIDRELARLNKDSIESTDTTVNLTFPVISPSQTTLLVLKKPKTESSVRKVYIPFSLAEKLREYKKAQDEMLAMSDFPSYNMVFCHDNGRPISDDTMLKRFKRLVQEHGLRQVDPYSLRHSGATAKLRASHDIKAVQGDMGHSSTDMLLNVYSDIVDEERQKLAAHMESKLYSDKTSEKDGRGQTTETNRPDSAEKAT